MSKDYYRVLGVDKNASQDEIKKAFRKLAHQCHPDKKGGDEEKFKEINEAYQVLGNQEKRQQYDQYGSSFEQMGGFGQGMNWEDFMQAARGGSTHGFSFDFEDLGLGNIFSELFGFSRGRPGSRRTQRGSDIQIEMILKFREAVFGVERTIQLAKISKCSECGGTGAEPGSGSKTCSVCQGAGQVQKVQNFIFAQFATTSICPECKGKGSVPEKICKKCHGKGAVRDRVQLRVKFPAGINSNETIRLNGQGNIGEGGSTAGDLYITVNVEPDRYFERRGYDILTQEKINFSQAVLGDKIRVETLEGKVLLKIPPVTESGKVFRLRGKGVPHLQGSGRGDQLVKVEIKIPTRLNKKQRKALGELEEAGL